MNSSNLLSDPELRRFGGQISLPEVGIKNQEKLKSAKVAVIGAGGLGSFVLQHLAALGVGHLGIIDYALVDEKNIQRQTLYGGNDLGKLKTIISKQNLQNLFPFANFEMINLELTFNNAERILKPFDLVIDATSSFSFHEVLSDACENLSTPWIVGSVKGFSGSVTVSNSSGKTAIKNFHEHIDKISNSDSGYISLSYGLVGNLTALEAFKLLVGIESSLQNKILLVDILNHQFTVKSLD